MQQILFSRQHTPFRDAVAMCGLTTERPNRSPSPTGSDFIYCILRKDGDPVFDGYWWPDAWRFMHDAYGLTPRDMALDEWLEQLK